MTTTSAASGRTTTNNTGRSIRTVWDTTLPNEEGTVQFVLETRHKKNHKVLATEVHTQVQGNDEAATIRRALLARSVWVLTFIPGVGVRMQLAASTRSPSTSTMQTRQLPSGR